MRPRAQRAASFQAKRPASTGLVGPRLGKEGCRAPPPRGRPQTAEPGISCTISARGGSPVERSAVGRLNDAPWSGDEATASGTRQLRVRPATAQAAARRQQTVLSMIRLLNEDRPASAHPQRRPVSAPPQAPRPPHAFSASHRTCASRVVDIEHLPAQPRPRSAVPRQPSPRHVRRVVRKRWGAPTPRVASTSRLDRRHSSAGVDREAGHGVRVTAAGKAMGWAGGKDDVAAAGKSRFAATGSGLCRHGGQRGMGHGHHELGKAGGDGLSQTRAAAAVATARLGLERAFLGRHREQNSYVPLVLRVPCVALLRGLTVVARVSCCV